MIVPGSTLFSSPVDHPFSWYAVVEDTRTGKDVTLWMNGNQMSREVVAQHIAAQYPYAKVKTIEQCTSRPTRALQPVPPTLFEHGYRIAVEKILGGNVESPLKDCFRPLALKPINLKPLVRR